MSDEHRPQHKYPRNEVHKAHPHRPKTGAGEGYQYSNGYREETAAEYTPNAGLMGGRSETELSSDRTQEADDEVEAGGGKGLGALGIALSIISFFFLPIVFSIAGIVFGAMAVRRDAAGVGYTAVAIGAIALILSVFFAPFVA